jgi:PAS domain S-box-containing protein
VKSPTILIVEDNPATRKMLRLALQIEGYGVLEAGSGREALQCLAEKPDLIIQDLLLPDVDGVQLVQSFRDRPEAATIPILCCSGFQPRMEQARSLGAGFTDYLFKPIEPSRLVRTVAAYLPRQNPIPKPRGRERRVLLVDDDPLQRKLATAHLVDAGFRVMTAGNGVEALVAARRTRPDVVLSDVLMPETDGFELCRQIRGDPKLAQVPIVLMSSAFTEAADSELARKVGASALVARTSDFQVAVGAVRAALREAPRARPASRAKAATDEYARRVARQLDRHVILNQRLGSRLALVEAQLGVLAGFTETLERASDVETILREAMYRCADAAGVSRALTFLVDPKGGLSLSAQIGFIDSHPTQLRDFFGRMDLLQHALATGEPVDLTARGPSGAGAVELLVVSGAESLLIAPFPLKSDRLGVMVLFSHRPCFDQSWFVFAEAVGASLAQAVSLSRAWARVSAAEARYRTIFENASDGIFRMTPDGQVVLGNPAFARLLGDESPEELGRGLDYFERLSVEPGNGAEFRRHLHESGSIRDSECRIRRRDGSVIWTSQSVRAVRDEHGQVLQYEGLVKDITERKKAEETARALADVGRLLSQSLDPEVVAQLIADNMLALCDARTSTVFRIQPQSGELVSVAAAGETGPAFGRNLIFPAGTGLIGLAVSQRGPVTTGNLLVDSRVTLTPELRERIEESEVLARLAVPLVVRERVIGVISVGDRADRGFGDEEIRLAEAFADQAAVSLENARLYAETERRRQEAEVLADLVGRIGSVFDLDSILQRVADGAKELCRADQAVIALRDNVTEAMMFRYWADAPYEGYSGLQVEPGKGSGGQVLATGRAFRTQNYAEDARITREYIESVQTNRVVAQLVVPIHGDDRIEGLLYVENRSPCSFTDPDEKVLLRLAGHAAIAIQNARRRELMYQSEKLAAMGQLLAGVAHELNNPLSVVLGQALLLLQSPSDRLAERIEKVTKAAERCVRVVKNFLALAREHPPEHTRVSLNKVVEDANELLAYQLRLDNVAVVLDLATDLPTLWADPHQLHQVVVNLITNARDAMREGTTPPRLTIATRSDPARARVVLEVIDTGPGVPSEIQARIFEPFFTTKPRGRGTGLGLALCKEVIQAHSGTFRVESEPGHGATFRVELPTVAPAGSEEVARASTEIRPVQGRTILVVDDEPEVASVLSDLLSSDGHVVETAPNGEVALRKLGEREYDLVLSDMRMAGLDGPGLYREVARRFPALVRRFIFLTGDVLSPETRRFIEDARIPGLSKPFDVEAIRRVVRSALSDLDLG